MFVIQVMVAPLDVIDDAVTEDITGAASGDTVKFAVTVAGEP